jgi:hypothetical protein
MFVLSCFRLRVGTVFSADWLRPFALETRLDFLMASVNRIQDSLVMPQLSVLG